MDMFEDISPDWTPPHCTSRKCVYHQHLAGPWPYKKAGFYRRPSDRRSVQRFQCRTCGVTFSTQTFSTTYWQKKPELGSDILMRSVGCMGTRQMARDLEASPETVNHHLARLGRHCLLLHSMTWEGDLPAKTVVVDGFESFEQSQYHPFHFNVAVEPETEFFMDFTDSEMRRKGRMTKQQQRRREQIEARYGRPDPKAIEKGMADLLRNSLRKLKRAVVRSDEHKAYPRAIRQIDCEIRHELTNSKASRTQHNPLWSVNLLDGIIRHSQSNHKRETIAFSKRRQGAIDRLAILLVWRNYMKSDSEKKPGLTPAMRRKMTDHPWKVREILSKRLFPDRIKCSPRWRDYYERCIVTPEIANNRRHELKYAF
jgi:transposase-like protein